MFGYDAPPKYATVTIWDPTIMAERPSASRYMKHSLVTTAGTITAYEDEETGIITTNLLGFEALMAAKA